MGYAKDITPHELLTTEGRKTLCHVGDNNTLENCGLWRQIQIATFLQYCGNDFQSGLFVVTYDQYMTCKNGSNGTTVVVTELSNGNKFVVFRDGNDFIPEWRDSVGNRIFRFPYQSFAGMDDIGFLTDMTYYLFTVDTIPNKFGVFIFRYNSDKSKVVTNNGVASYINGSGQKDLTDWDTFVNGAIPPSDIIGTGGGATHIAKVTGLLSTLSSSLSDILIVAGGGGGGMVSSETAYTGANAGGISGSGSNSADQSTGYAFGQGESSGGGSGLYGGYKAANSNGGGAGSGYIGNALLDAKKMVGYNVPTSSTASTKTESVNTYSATPTADTPKAGNGFAKISFIQ